MNSYAYSCKYNFIIGDAMTQRTWTNEELILAVKNSKHITEALQKLNLNCSTYNSNTIKKYIKELNISIEHWKGNLVKTKRNGFETNIEDVFIENSKFTRSHLKEKIIKYKLLPYKCAECELSDIWNNKQLVLQLDHINGINNDNRINNLRFLCPNCHSQTSTYAGGKIKGRKFIIHTCIKCGGRRTCTSKSGLCIKCKSTQDKINWPSTADLLQMINDTNVHQTAKKINVTDAAIYKRLNKIKSQ